jgi:hypothetical protein
MTTSNRHPRLRAAGVAAGLAAAVSLFTTGTAGAVGPHQHTITTPTGTHDVASGFCNGNFAAGTPQNVAITNFHTKIHVGPGGPDGVVTLGGHGCS